MFQVSASLTNNVDEKILLKFLTEKGCIQSEDDEGKDINVWLGTLLEAKQIKETELNSFFLDELFFGMHRNINIYKIASYRKAKYVQDWCEKILAEYNISNIEYNNILRTNVNREENEKIAAVKCIYDETYKIEKLRILFVKQIDIIKESGISSTYSYIPIEVDFTKNILIIKGRPRKKIHKKEHKHKNLMNYFFLKVTSSMEIEIESFGDVHQQALYLMSKGILEDLFTKIPSSLRIPNMQGSINNFLQEIIKTIPLENIETSLNKEGIEEKVINKRMLDVGDEINKLLQQLVLADYFFKRDEDKIFDTGLSEIITCIRFNDSTNTNTRVNGENRRKHIFNSNAFMGIRNAIETVKTVETLSIAYKKGKGTMHLKFDATEYDYLSFLVYKQYDATDFDKMWEMYREYESSVNGKVAEVCTASTN